MSREYVRQENAGADKMELEKYTLGSLRRAVFEGDTTTGSLMAGQVAGMLHEVRPVADILADLWNSGRQRIAALSTECSWRHRRWPPAGSSSGSGCLRRAGRHLPAGERGVPHP